MFLSGFSMLQAMKTVSCCKHLQQSSQVFAIITRAPLWDVFYLVSWSYGATQGPHMFEVIDVQKQVSTRAHTIFTCSR